MNSLVDVAVKYFGVDKSIVNQPIGVPLSSEFENQLTSVLSKLPSSETNGFEFQSLVAESSSMLVYLKEVAKELLPVYLSIYSGKGLLIDGTDGLDFVNVSRMLNQGNGVDLSLKKKGGGHDVSLNLLSSGSDHFYFTLKFPFNSRHIEQYFVSLVVN